MFPYMGQTTDMWAYLPPKGKHTCEHRKRRVFRYSICKSSYHSYIGNTIAGCAMLKYIRITKLPIECDPSLQSIYRMDTWNLHQWFVSLADSQHRRDIPGAFWIMVHSHMPGSCALLWQNSVLPLMKHDVLPR